MALALVVSRVETVSGYVGDSSLVPAILTVGGLVAVTIITAGFICGNIILTLKG